MLRSWTAVVALAFMFVSAIAAQEPAAAQKPTEHLLGSITGIQSDTQTITVKDDKSSQAYAVSLIGTRTLLKVAPGAKDLKQAQRITAADLVIGDRVDVRGFPGDAAGAIQARSVVLMSARELAAKHESDAAEWQQSIVAKATALNAAANTIQADVRTPDGTKNTAVQVTPTTEFLRFDPTAPKTPAPSTLDAVQVGDQLHIIGTPAADGTSVAATKIYSASVRTVTGTIVAASANPPTLTVKDTQSQKPVTINLTDSTVIKKIPPEMAAAMKGRSDGNGAPAAGGPPSGQSTAANASTGNPQAPRPRRDINRMIQHLPSALVADLQAGSAVIVSGFAGASPDNLIAATVIAGVEPLLQSSPQQRAGNGGRPVSADWGLDTPMPAQ